MKLPSSHRASAAQAVMHSLRQYIHRIDEETGQLASLLAEKEAKKRVTGYGRKVEDEAICTEIEISDLKAQRQKVMDRRSRAEEELSNLQSRVAELKSVSEIVLIVYSQSYTVAASLLTLFLSVAYTYGFAYPCLAIPPLLVIRSAFRPVLPITWTPTVILWAGLFLCMVVLTHYVSQNCEM